MGAVGWQTRAMEIYRHESDECIGSIRDPGCILGEVECTTKPLIMRTLSCP